jgi:hypothetical protein
MSLVGLKLLCSQYCTIVFSVLHLNLYMILYGDFQTLKYSSNRVKSNMQKTVKIWVTLRRNVGKTCHKNLSSTLFTRQLFPTRIILSTEFFHTKLFPGRFNKNNWSVQDIRYLKVYKISYRKDMSSRMTGKNQKKQFLLPSCTLTPLFA